MPAVLSGVCGMLEININSAEVLYKQKEETINE